MAQFAAGPLQIAVPDTIDNLLMALIVHLIGFLPRCMKILSNKPGTLL